MKDAPVARMRLTIDRDSLDSVNVRIVSSKGLGGFSASDVPQLGRRIARTRDEHVLVRAKR